MTQRKWSTGDVALFAGPEFDKLRISEICDLTGLSTRTVRYYEELGLLPGVRRSRGGRRVYGRDELARLGFIQHLKTLGLSLGEIKDLNAVYAIAGSTRAMLGRLEELLAQRLADVDARMSDLAMLRTEITRYRKRMSERARELGAREASR